jgi:uncharacterized membrane protein YgdD (TMEM256/DUF423 family)
VIHKAVGVPHQRLFYLRKPPESSGNHMKANLVIQLAALSGFLSVALGAFGAHGLKNRLSQDMMAIYHTAVQYQFLHTLALLAVGILIQQWGKSTALTVSAASFIFGILVFQAVYMC